MKTGALLHYDVEFTHPSPACGQPMEFGFVAQMALFYDDGRIVPEESRQEFECLWPVTQAAHVTHWVQENQVALLKKCRNLTAQGLSQQRQRDKIVGWLRAVKNDFGEHLVPCGWTTGSDYAYLLQVLGEDCHLVHYDGLDVSSLAVGAFGRLPADDELHRLLDVAPQVEGDKHIAIRDACHQSELMNELLRRA